VDKANIVFNLLSVLLLEMKCRKKKETDMSRRKTLAFGRLCCACGKVGLAGLVSCADCSA
jgi:hypothetical protein